jgi:hypothetical protein
MTILALEHYLLPEFPVNWPTSRRMVKSECDCAYLLVTIFHGHNSCHCQFSTVRLLFKLLKAIKCVTMHKLVLAHLFEEIAVQIGVL